MPAAPGTWGSLAGLFLCLLLHANTILYIAVFIILFFAGIYVSGKVAEEEKDNDPSIVVIDEFACVFVVFFHIPLKLFLILIGFALYRLFDIIKPPPARQLENIKGGAGIMLDDLAAAIYANLILHIIAYFQIF